LTEAGLQRIPPLMAIGRLKGVEDTAEKPAKENVQRLRQQLDSYMAQQGLRSTGQRRVIVDQFLRTKGHITIDDLLEQVRVEDAGIGYATVYRTMKMLAAGGIASEHKFTDGMTRYELADEETHHDHLICVECGRIQEFEEPLIEELQERIAKQYKFRIVEHKHELYGVCSQCTSKASAESSTRPHAGDK
jgi:Fur family transcriptional regulator, ferric uptake regulator